MYATSATVEAMCKSRPPRITLEESPLAAEMRFEPAGPSLCYEDLPEVMLGASSKPAGRCKTLVKASIDASEAWDLCVEDSTLEEEDQAVDSSGESCQAITSTGPGIDARSGHLGPVHLSGSEWPSLPEALDDFVDCETSSLSSWLDVGEPDLAFDEESGAVLVRPDKTKPLTWAERARQLGGGPSKPRGVPIPPLVRLPANNASLQVLATVGEDEQLDDLERRRLCPDVSRGATQRRRKR